MGDKTLVIMKIKPVDMEKIDETVDALKGITAGDLKDVQKEDIGFGIQIVKAGFLISEKEEGALAALEAAVSKLSSVEESEVEAMTLL
jgi:translation elongation factor EF-1beta